MDSIPLLCPTCSEQVLQITATALGSIDRCPSCGWFFIDLKTLVGYSEDKDQFNASIAEARQFLLPTGRDCPKGPHKLQDGRVGSRGVILTFCPPCEALWTDLNTLGRLNEALERSLRAQLETVVTAESGSADAWRPGADAIAPIIDDKGFAGFLRRAALFFNGMANRFGKPKPLPAPKAAQRAAPAPVWEPPAPAPIPEKQSQAATPVPEPPMPKEPVIVERPVHIQEPKQKAEPSPVPEVIVPELKPIIQEISKPEPISEPEPAPKLEPVTRAAVEATEKKDDARRRILSDLGKVEQPSKWIDLPQPQSQKTGFMGKITSLFKPKTKPSKPVTSVKPIAPAPETEKIASEVPEQPKKASSPKKLGFLDLFKPLPKISPKPPVPVVKKPVEMAAPEAIKTPDKVEEPKPKSSEKKSVAASKRKGAITQFFALFKPLPKPSKSVTPPAKEVPVPAPVKLPPPEPEMPKKSEPTSSFETVSVATARKAEKPKSSVFSQFLSLFKPLPKKEKPNVTPVSVAAEAKLEPQLPISVAEVNPVIKTPPPGPMVLDPEIKASEVPPIRSTGKGGRGLWKGRLLIWLPRLGPVAVIVIMGLAGDNEWGTAIAWGIVSWAVIRLNYLAFMYPFKGFSPASIADLLGDNRFRLKGKPVELKGRLENRSGNAVGFVDNTGGILLDRFASWEFAARLLAVANLSQFVKEDEITIRGWYRSGASPFVEVNEIRTSKTYRKALVRWMRWGVVFLTVIVATLILFGMD